LIDSVLDERVDIDDDEDDSESLLPRLPTSGTDLAGLGFNDFFFGMMLVVEIIVSSS